MVANGRGPGRDIWRELRDELKKSVESEIDLIRRGTRIKPSERIELVSTLGVMLQCKSPHAQLEAQERYMEQRRRVLERIEEEEEEERRRAQNPSAPVPASRTKGLW